jgi:histidyl-tRNA synthetase
MAYYQRDNRLVKAIETIKNLDETNERESLINYYIEHSKAREKEKDESLKKYKQFFSLLKELTPRTFTINDTLI